MLRIVLMGLTYPKKLVKRTDNARREKIWLWSPTKTTFLYVNPIYIQPTWKRTVGSKVRKNGASDAGSKVYAKKRYNHADMEEKSLKKQKNAQMTEINGMDTSMAKVGIDQPRHIL